MLAVRRAHWGQLRKSVIFEFAERKLLAKSRALSSRTSALHSERNALQDAVEKEERREHLEKVTGWYGIDKLLTVESFESWRKRVEAECKALRAIARAELDVDKKSLTVGRARLLLQVLDTISARLCLLLDTAGVCSSSHSDHNARETAMTTYGTLSLFVTKLNMDASLYKPLANIVDTPEVFECLTPEEQRTATSLKAEFERDGIRLSVKEKEKVELLQALVRQTELQYAKLEKHQAGSVELSLKESTTLLMEAPRLAGMWKFIPNAIPPKVELPVNSSSLSIVLRKVSNGSLRSRFYKQSLSLGAEENISLLRGLVASRHQLALALGFENFADFAISFRMASSTKQVLHFLNEMNEKVSIQARREAEELTAIKQATEGIDSGPLQAWDVPFYTERVLQTKFGSTIEQANNYFSLENCLNGIQLICSELFALTFEHVPLGEHESWAPGVRKIIVREEDGTPTGVLYLDLFERQGKYPNPAHFQVKCSHFAHPLRYFVHSVDPNRISHAPLNSRETGTYVLPSSVLVCNFENSNALLHPTQAQTFFHEFGHALQSLLSRTAFQHLSGTRGELDFVETPSQLMEYFCLDERVLQRFAFHHQTGEPIPSHVVEALNAAKGVFKGMDLQQQILYAVCDQKLFSDRSMVNLLSDRDRITKMLQDLNAQYSQVPHVDGTFWLSKFSHFVNYGAAYYSYTFSKAFAADLWHTCFKANPLDRKTGETYRREILSRGGTRDPVEMLTAMLGRAPSVDALITEVEGRHT